MPDYLDIFASAAPPAGPAMTNEERERAQARALRKKKGRERALRHSRRNTAHTQATLRAARRRRHMGRKP